MTFVAARAPRVVLTYGRFDLFHNDHVTFLRKVSMMGSELIVGCTSDAHAEAMGLPCQMPFEERRALLEHCRFVSRVIPETDAAQKRTDIVNYNVCALAMGTEHAGQFDGLQDIAQVLYLSRGKTHAAVRGPVVAAKRLAFG